MSNLFNVFVSLNLLHDVSTRGKCWLIYPDMRTLLPFLEAQYDKFRNYSDKRTITNKRSCTNKRDYMYCIFIRILFFFYWETMNRCENGVKLLLRQTYS